MSTVIKRTIVLFAALMLAGATTGCERNTADQERVENPIPGQVDDYGIDEPGAMDEQPGEMAQQDEQPGEMGEQPGAMGEQPGAMAQNDALEKTRDEVSGDLDIPVTAVIISPQDQSKLAAATDDIERKGLVTVSTVQTYIARLDPQSFTDDDQREAYNELQTDVTTLNQDLQQYGMAQGDQRDEMKDRIDDKLDDVNENFKEISSLIVFDRSAATGGGPLMDDEQPSMDDQQPSEMDNSGELNAPNEGIGEPSDQGMDQYDNEPSTQPEDQQPGTQPSDQPAGGTQTY